MPRKKKEAPVKPLTVSRQMAAKLLSVSEKTVGRWIRDGHLRDVGPGHRCLITMASIEAFVGGDGK